MSGLTRRARARLRRERERLESSSEETDEINLVPYLDIVTNILLFLIVTITSMIAVGNIEVNTPEREGPSAVAEATPTNQPDLNLTVAITGTGFTVAGSGGFMYQNDVPGKLPTVPKLRGGEYDFAALHRLLAKVKKQYPAENRAILAANPEIQYETVIGVMDVLRIGPDNEDLFPVVLFSTGFQ
jgi:biopolymer transport protein ExbD